MPSTTLDHGRADRWGGRADATRVVLRAIGIGAFSYVLVRRGTLHDPVWVVAVTALSWLLLVVTAVLRSVRRFDRWSLGVIVVMMLGGAVVNPQIDFLGTTFFVIGGAVLVGRPEVPARVGIAVVVLTGLVTVVVAGLSVHTWGSVVAIGAGVVAIGLFGALRREARVRQAQDRELAARSRELELRNADLVAQTDATRRETARAAALEERGRIARDLHDVLAHSLGGLVVQLEAADAELAAGDLTGASARLAASRRLAVEGLRDARVAVQQLRSDPGDGDGRDPVAAVDAVLHGPVGLQLAASLEVVGRPRPVGSAVAEVLIAVTREALTNANKHATGQRVSAALVFERDDLRLDVVNGLATASSDLTSTGSGVGLVGLAERVRALGGRFEAGAEGQRWVVSAQCPNP